MTTKKEPVILSIESSGSTCGIALSEGFEIIAAYSVYQKNIHDKLMAENIRRISADTATDLNKIDAVAVSAGPGSFTGLRIGGSIAKGLSFVSDIKLIAVPNLNAFAFAAGEKAAKFHYEEIVGIIPSQKNNFFIQKFDLKGNELSEIEILEKKEVKKILSKKLLICGNGAPELDKKLKDDYLCRLNVEFISLLAAKYFENNIFTEPADYIPIYVQDFVAKTRKKEIYL